MLKLKLTANRRRLIWAAVITAALWLFGPVVDFFANRESVTISGETEQPPLSVTGSEQIMGVLAVVTTFALVFAVLWFVAVRQDMQKSRQRVG